MASTTSRATGSVARYTNGGEALLIPLKAQTRGEQRDITNLLKERLELQAQKADAQRIQKEAYEEELAIKAAADKKRSDIKAQADKERAEVKAQADKERAEVKAQADKERAEVKAQADKERAEVKAQADKERAAVIAAGERAQREILNKTIRQILPRVLGVGAELINTSFTAADIEFFGCDLQKKCLIMDDASAQVLLNFAKDHTEVQKFDLKICKENITQQAIVTLLKAIEQTNISSISFARPLNEIEKNEKLKAIKKAEVQGRKLVVESA